MEAIVRHSQAHTRSVRTILGHDADSPTIGDTPTQTLQHRRSIRNLFLFGNDKPVEDDIKEGDADAGSDTGQLKTHASNKTAAGKGTLRTAARKIAAAMTLAKGESQSDSPASPIPGSSENGNKAVDPQSIHEVEWQNCIQVVTLSSPSPPLPSPTFPYPDPNGKLQRVSPRLSLTRHLCWQDVRFAHLSETY